MYDYRDRLSALLAVDPQVDQGAWKQHGSLLASIDRLAVEIEAAAREPDTEWQPEPMMARQWEAGRRILGATAAHPADPQASSGRETSNED